MKTIFNIVGIIYKFPVKLLGGWGILVDIVVSIILFCAISDLLLTISLNREERKKKRKGTRFENKTAKKIEDAFGVKPIQNILIYYNPDNEKASNEIDMAFVTKKGIFAVECKYRNCYEITGSFSSDIWSLKTSTDGDIITIDNPFNQNSGHIRSIKNNLPIKTDAIYSIVSVSCLINMNVYGETINDSVINRISEEKLALVKNFRKFSKQLNSLPDQLTDEEVNICSEWLKAHKGTKAQLKEHEEYVKDLQVMEDW